MSFITLQTRGVDITTKERAEEKVQKNGFENIHDFIRYVVVRLAHDDSFYIEKTYKLSPSLEKEIEQGLEDYRKGRYIVLESDEDIDNHYNKIFNELDSEEQNNRDNSISQKGKKANKKQ